MTQVASEEAVMEPDTSAPEPAEEAAASPAAADSSMQVAAPIFEQFAASGTKSGAHNDIDMILDIPVQLTIELGRTKIAIKNLLQLAQGSVVELSKFAGEPLEVLVNDKLVARGEVVVVEDRFGVRITELTSG